VGPPHHLDFSKDELGSISAALALPDWGRFIFAAGSASLWRCGGCNWSGTGHIGKMPQYVDEAFVVLVHVYSPEGGDPERREYLVACPTREAAEDRIKVYFTSAADIKLFASPLSTSETARLNLIPNEIRLRQ
jgi:hypothetical protein